MVRQLPAAHGAGEKLLVADTSALLDRPSLQEWKIDGTPWTVVLVPQVLSELDERKRDPRTREAAQKVINQLDDFDRRGVYETAIVIAIAVGVLVAALVIVTPLGAGPIALIAFVTFVLGLVGALVFLAG